MCFLVKKRIILDIDVIFIFWEGSLMEEYKNKISNNKEFCFDIMNYV